MASELQKIKDKERKFRPRSSVPGVTLAKATPLNNLNLERIFAKMYNHAVF